MYVYIYRIKDFYLYRIEVYCRLKVKHVRVHSEININTSCKHSRNAWTQSRQMAISSFRIYRKPSDNVSTLLFLALKYCRIDTMSILSCYLRLYPPGEHIAFICLIGRVLDCSCHCKEDFAKLHNFIL